MALTLAQLREAAAKLPETRDVQVDELGGVVRVRRLTAGECVDLGGDFGKSATIEQRSAAMDRACAWAIVDDSGGQVFSSVDQFRELRLPFGLVAQVFGVIADMSGLFVDNSVEDAAKN